MCLCVVSNVCAHCGRVCVYPHVCDCVVVVCVCVRCVCGVVCVFVSVDVMHIV